jgi:hypothetical protein
LSINNKQQHTNKYSDTCNALDCKEKATIEIKIDAGKFGKIHLFLCKECLPKFNIKGGQKIC